MEPEQAKALVQHKMIIPSEYTSVELPLSDNFNELKFAMVCELTIEPSIKAENPDDKKNPHETEMLKVWGMPEDLDNLRLKGHGVHPPGPRPRGKLFIKKSKGLNYSTLKIIAYLKNNKTISFASKGIVGSRLTIGDVIPQNTTINVLRECQLYGQLKAEELITLILKRRAIITELEILSKTVHIDAHSHSKIEQLSLAANLVLTTSEHVTIENLNLNAETITSTIGNHSNIKNITGKTVFHEFRLGDFVTYLCDELKCERDTKAIATGIGCLTGFSSTNVLVSLRNRSSINVTRTSKTFTETPSLESSLDQVNEEN
jgi:hypothetical protein